MWLVRTMNLNRLIAVKLFIVLRRRRKPHEKSCEAVSLSYSHLTLCYVCFEIGEERYEEIKHSLVWMGNWCLEWKYSIAASERKLNFFSHFLTGWKKLVFKKPIQHLALLMHHKTSIKECFLLSSKNYFKVNLLLNNFMREFGIYSGHHESGHRHHALHSVYNVREWVCGLVKWLAGNFMSRFIVVVVFDRPLKLLLCKMRRELNVN